MLQMSTAGQGVMTTSSELAGWASSALWRGANEVGSIRAGTAVAAGSVLGAFALGLYSNEAGAGSSQVPGRDVNLFALQASLAAAGMATIQPGMTSVNLPVRGFITTDDDGKQSVNFVRTGVGGVSPSVPVFRPVRDELTGLDKITLPAMAGVPARTILINPVPTGPAAPSHTGNGSPVPSTPVHTGTNVRQADSIVVTTFPADVVQDLQDFILWQPDATEVGVEAIYVMVSKPYGETNAKGKYSGRDYNTDKAGGPIQNLDWKGASIDRAGVDKVKLHTGRFGESPDNKVMIDRLEKILKGELQATDTDKRFYTHEIRELERYRALGVSDGVSDDSVWNSAHTATLEDYKINEKNQPMYTPEALEAYRKAEEGK